jgi:hypothetical protein
MVWAVGKRLATLGALCAALAAAACVGFEHTETIISPSLPSLPNAPAGPGSLTGTWASIAPPGMPNSWSCGSFHWTITSQTPSSLAGEFYAICAAVVLVHGQASGQLNAAGTEVALRVSGIATVQGVISCPFDLSGTGYIEGTSAIRIPYSGTTCLGPVHGEETLRRPLPDEPTPEPPHTPEPETPTETSPNPNHVAPGPLTRAQAEQVVYATAREFPNLTAAPATESEGIARAEELLLRTIWHLRLYGFDAGRQRNPSGAISNDKLTILVDGAWRVFDIFMDLARPGVPMRVIFLEITGANPIAYPGIPD